MSSSKTKNDICWEALFEKYNILNQINNNGYYKILARDIKKCREPRLMCKFDHISQLPKIFKKNNLRLLALSRTEYIIGTFEVFQKLHYSDEQHLQIKSLPFHIESIQPSDLYSESISLHAAHISGMFHDVLNIKQNDMFFATVSGRMGSGNFDFFVNDVSNEMKHKISITGAQIEIDAAYETKDAFIIVEAKKQKVNDFNIRQLYYPYKTWRNKLNKEIVPVFFTVSNDIFSIFVYKFQDDNIFNSIKCIEQKHYLLTDEHIDMVEVIELCKKIKIKPEPQDVPFPQANSLERVIDLLSLLYEERLERTEITELYDFTSRQTDYYCNIGRYLGLIKKVREKDGIYYFLSERGQHIMSLPYRRKYLSIFEVIFEHGPFNEGFLWWIKQGKTISVEQVVELIEKYGHSLSESTKYRRAESLIAWLGSIDSLINRR
ncbi:MAG TPA: hypothetical protein VK982_02345 [Bacteroidales bacterium]|nr:hypothetical protein [Bacteroidales bacterium]